jgi:AMP-binding enzyme
MSCSGERLRFGRMGPALLVPPDRERFTDGAPRHLTYAQADRAVSAIAGRLRRIGLQTDAIVAMQMANTVENVLTFLGILRAGLIAMPLPLLWRRVDAVAALRRVGATALIVSGRIGTTDHFALAREIAAEIFPIRYLCGYGREPPDGLVPFDDIFVLGKVDPIPAWEEERGRDHGPGAHLAVITWDVAADGLVPVTRSHSELIAGGLAVMLESRLQEEAALLSTLTLCSFAGLAITLVPWLLLGGTVALHHPFDVEAFLNQLSAFDFDAAVVPGPMATQLSDQAHRAGTGCPSMIGVWRAPERVSRAPPWRVSGKRMTDVMVFGETGLLAACRGASGKAETISYGGVTSPRGHKGGITTAEVKATSSGTIAMRGPMVPRAPFPPGAERSGFPHLKIGANGLVDTGYGCHADSASIIVTGPPPGMISVGGYRFMIEQVQELIKRLDAEGRVAVLPDAFAGHRLVGTAAHVQAVQDALAQQRINPLIAAAFRERTPAPDARVSVP